MLNKTKYTDERGFFMGENILEKTEGRVSYHDSVEEMLKRIREDGLTNVFDRYALQEKRFFVNWCW